LGRRRPRSLSSAGLACWTISGVILEGSRLPCAGLLYLLSSRGRLAAIPLVAGWDGIKRSAKGKAPLPAHSGERGLAEREMKGAQATR
jgi:hypothetical protein